MRDGEDLVYGSREGFKFRVRFARLNQSYSRLLGQVLDEAILVSLDGLEDSLLLWISCLLRRRGARGAGIIASGIAMGRG